MFTDKPRFPALRDFFPFDQPGDSRFQDPVVDFDHDSVALGKRHEIRRYQSAQLGVVPADKCLGSHQFALGGKLGLVQ